MKSSLIIEDLTSWGQMSMTSALTITQSYGIYTATLPVQIFSTQTEGFGVPKRLSSLSWLEETTAHWKSNGITSFDSALIGYLGENKFVRFVDDLINAGNCDFLIVDPVMGDRGKLYPGLDDEYIKRITLLASKADLITPNVTELGMLINQSLTSNTEYAEIQKGLMLCQKQFRHCQVVVTGVSRNGETGCMWLENGNFKLAMTNKVEGHFYGTGDLFSAITNALIVQHASWSLQSVFSTAVKLVSIAIQQTVDANVDYKNGLILRDAIKEMLLIK
ncbi:bifunctional hydroxymethylpyrimidine kinase/phosphomethylpyrimidine kinase [Furfurilactobacillus siliginis]|uniref:pyridoxal kinase n=1 Tax=Furfurilactobacillus siliginis TaxID=348151 RepID=A0A0R2L8T8_9LACO|nr:bifunctional hydroxymethylpyrimidine kinase/phosphomethylpyrimidine kinase [Furfurilactobacillus siliginis]KRN96245.1 pyridoxal kinase [Furfurilactobacillus siliginis]GEK27830.1 pyridoxal kinase [Furfurilactobacillus siliginis]